MTPRFLVQDERGGVIAGTNASGGTVFKNKYDDYGRPAAANVGRLQYAGPGQGDDGCRKPAAVPSCLPFPAMIKR